jgi:hypothetical protein
MSASAAIVYKGQANRVNFDGYPELMFPALEWRSEDEVNALVTGREIRALGEPGKNPPSHDEFYSRNVWIRGDPKTIGSKARRAFVADYVYSWTPTGWICT